LSFADTLAIESANTVAIPSDKNILLTAVLLLDCLSVNTPTAEEVPAGRLHCAEI